MNEALSKIGFYHGLFLVCLAGALILFAVSLVLFIRRDIRSAIAFLAGHRAKREIRRLEAENGWVREEKDAGKKRPIGHAQEEDGATEVLTEKELRGRSGSSSLEKSKLAWSRTGGKKR